MRIGWLSTGRDQAASNLLSDVVARAQQGDVPLDIGAVFCDRERGEADAQQSEPADARQQRIDRLECLA